MPNSEQARECAICHQPFVMGELLAFNPEAVHPKCRPVPEDKRCIRCYSMTSFDGEYWIHHHNKSVFCTPLKQVCDEITAGMT